MAILQLPLNSDEPNYRFRITLEGTDYVLIFRFNFRISLWIMDIIDADLNPIRMGIPILLGVSLLGQYVDSRLPPGELIAINLKDENIEAGRDDLGNDVILLYGESA